MTTTRNRRSVWEVTTEPCPEAHFATYPTRLVEPCVLAGCPEGGVVMDPFAGSGTTALVSLRLGRRFWGSELNPEYFSMARRRIEMEASQTTLFDAPVKLPLEFPEPQQAEMF